MSNPISTCLDAMKKGISSLKNVKKDKQAYREYLARIQALPAEYRFVFKKITRYMWSLYGGGDGYDMIGIHGDLLELFEQSAADGKAVMAVTGVDVAAFCDELLRNAKTYTENWRKKLNDEIRKKLP